MPGDRSGINTCVIPNKRRPRIVIYPSAGYHSSRSCMAAWKTSRTSQPGLALLKVSAFDTLAFFGFNKWLLKMQLCRNKKCIRELLRFIYWLLKLNRILTHRARNPGKQLNSTVLRKVLNQNFWESGENSGPFLPRTCMFCKIFSDDQEMATNQKIGLCDYLRTERYSLTSIEGYTAQHACDLARNSYLQYIR